MQTSNKMELPFDKIKTVIMAGGKGTRLYPLVQDIPKPMILIQNKPLIHYIINNSRKWGFSQFLLKLCYMPEKITSYFRKNSYFGGKMDYFVETEPLGTAGGLKFLEKEENPVFILYGDVMLNVNLKKMLKYHLSIGADATLLIHKSKHPEDSDVVILGEDYKIQKIIHKPGSKDYGDITNAALYIFNPICFSFISEGKSDFGKDIIPDLINKGMKVYGYYTEEYMKDVGTVERIKEVEEDIINGKVINSVEAVFLDRDGVINEEVNCLHKVDDFKLIPNVPSAINALNTINIPVIVITNQPVVARNLCSEDYLHKIHTHMISELERNGAYIDDIFYCPHHPEKHHADGNPIYRIDCECRKPKIGMLLEAQKRYGLDLSKCFMIGDTTTDIMTGKNAGCKTILVRTGYNGKDKKHEVEPDYTFNSLMEASEFILNYNKGYK